MADFGTALSVVQTLFAVLQCPLLKEACSVLDYESKLEDLKRTVITIKSVFVDAGYKIELSQTDLNYIHLLKDAVYEADDLFDKFLTLAERKKNGNLSDKVRNFFSSQNPFKVAYTIFRDVQKIRNHLNAIADDRTKFGFSIDTQLLRRRREDTCSYVYAHDVVGRDDDATKVIHRLLDFTADVGFLTIVGIGGLGKTTLAKLIFGHERIRPEFGLRLWVCVADQDGAQLDVKNILSKMIKSAGYKLDNGLTIEEVQSEYQRHLSGKKILLVLDDIWTENVREWNKFREFLMVCGKGSRIVATTRSKETARIIGNGTHTNTYELDGLSEEDSWRLFEMSAFEKGSKHHNFIEIGENIVEKCSNLPLAIKVVGSLLYGQPIGKWQAFETNGFVGTSNGDNEVISILKFSYDYLEPSLKSCFAYCAIFPKDYVIDKEMIMDLWEAQGYIVPFDKGQSIENASEEHFSVLVKRCFFQDVKKNEYGDVESFKIHDLMHDLAQRVVENEICVYSMANLDYRIARHLFEDRALEDREGEDGHFVKSQIRSYLNMSERPKFYHGGQFPVDKIARNWVCLRALALTHLINYSLPDTMGNLLHLRYLNLANNLSMAKLPESIARLHNLRTLNLNGCCFFRKWPKDFVNLVNLTRLYINNCEMLCYMPVGMSKLTRLRVLTNFVVTDESAGGMRRVGQLKDLKPIAVNLKGRISIDFCECFTSSEGYNWEGSCLEGAEHLNEVHISFSVRYPTVPNSFSDIFEEGTGERGEEKRVKEEYVMQKLQPHPNVRKFVLSGYMGEKIEKWGRSQVNWVNCLPRLVHIKILNCKCLQQLPLLRELMHLKSLHLSALHGLEYMEEAAPNSIGSGSSGSRESEFTFFPNLAAIKIYDLTQLKGWWRTGDSSIMAVQPSFPCLSAVTIKRCPKLTSFPSSESRLDSCQLHENNEALSLW